MSAYDFEQVLRDRMRERAADIDRSVGSAPPLRTLLAGRRTAVRPRMSTGLRLALAVATVDRKSVV